MNKFSEYRVIGWRSYKRIEFTNDDGTVSFVNYSEDDRSSIEIFLLALRQILSMVLF